MFISYTNSKISLEPFLESDIELFSLWDMDRKVQEFMPEPTNEESTREDHLKYINECSEEKNEIHAVIVDNESKKRIGTIAIIDINEYHQVAELGIVIGNKNFWGRGFATEATKAILEYVILNTKIRRILAECEMENTGERKVLERSGFYLECISIGSRIKNKKPIDTTRYVWFR
jgi:RimJ/RimL family protein N-acetyltransferase